MKYIKTLEELLLRPDKTQPITLTVGNLVEIISRIDELKTIIKENEEKNK